MVLSPAPGEVSNGSPQWHIGPAMFTESTSMPVLKAHAQSLPPVLSLRRWKGTRKGV